MAVNNGQSSYDPRFIRKLFPESDTYMNSALAELFDVNLHNWTSCLRKNIDSSKKCRPSII